jgi:secreted trypsin-like serine protease
VLPVRQLIRVAIKKYQQQQLPKILSVKYNRQELCKKQTKSENIVVPIQSKILCGRRAVNNDPLSGMSTKNGDWPWQVAIFQLLEFELSYVCGGSLIGNNYILTGN